MCFYIIKYVYSFQRTRIFFPHFVGVFIYAGTINRPLRLRTVCQNIADGLPKHCERIAKMLLTDCQNIANIPQNANEQSVKCATNTPLGVGADSSCPYPDVTKNVYFHNQICVFTLLNMYIHFTTHAFPFVISWVHSYMRAR